jgi:hypothetical protein
MAALAAAASSRNAAGVPLRLQRLVLEVVWGPDLQAVHSAVTPLLEALPHLQHIHLRLLPHDAARWQLHNLQAEEAAVLALAQPLRRLTALTSLVLEGPVFYIQDNPQQEQQQQQHLLGPEAGAAGWQLRGPPTWLAGMCAALPPSLQELQWTMSVRANGADQVQLLPLRLGHLTALQRLALAVCMAGNVRAAAAVPRSTLQPLRGLQQLRLSGVDLLPLPALAQQASCLVHWRVQPAASPLASTPAAIQQLVAQLSCLVSLDLSALADTAGADAGAAPAAAYDARRAAAGAATAATEAGVRAVCSGAQQLTRLHLGLHDKRLEEDGRREVDPAIAFCSLGPLQRLTSLSSLRCLALTIHDAAVIPCGLRCLTQLTQLQVSIADGLGNWDISRAMLSMWVWAVGSLTQLQALSIPWLLTASCEPWLQGLQQLVVLHLGWREQWIRFGCMVPMASRRLGQFACTPGSALQLVLLDPGADELRKHLVFGQGWPSRVVLAVSDRATAAAAGQEAWPPEVWRALQ